MCPHKVFLKFLSSYLEVLSVELRLYISCPFCIFFETSVGTLHTFSLSQCAFGLLATWKKKKYMSSIDWVRNSIPKGLCGRFIKFHCTCEFAVLDFNFETQTKRNGFLFSLWDV
jgi:hypothetical protein